MVAMGRFFSAQPLTDELLAPMFRSFEGSSVIRHSWTSPGAYPLSRPVQRYPKPGDAFHSFVLHEHSSGAVLFPAALEAATVLPIHVPQMHTKHLLGLLWVPDHSHLRRRQRRAPAAAWLEAAKGLRVCPLLPLAALLAAAERLAGQRLRVGVALGQRLAPGGGRGRRPAGAR